MSNLRKQNFALSVYVLFILGLTFFLDYSYTNQSLINSTEILKQSLEANQSVSAMAGAIMLSLFFSGLVIVSIYAFFIKHKHHLKKPQKPFSAFYFVFAVWLAIFVSVDFLIAIVAPFIPIMVSLGLGIILSLIITTLVNLSAVILMQRFKIFAKTKLLYTNKQLLWWGVGGYLAIFPFFIIAAAFNDFLLKALGNNFPIQPIIELTIANKNLAVTIAMAVAIIILAPFFEEIIMRGLVFRGLLSIYSPWLAMIISGLIFSLIHYNVSAFVPIMMLGFLLAWLYNRTGSLIPSIIAHSLFNAVNFIFLKFLI